MSSTLKSSLCLLALLVLILTACAPAQRPARQWSDVTAPETTTRAMPLTPLAATQNAGTASAPIQNCPSGSANEPANPFILLNVEPVEARAGKTLTYCIQLTPASTDVFLPPDVLLHLPAGSKSLKTAGAGWTCDSLPDQQDNLIPSLHIDLVCRNLVVSGARYPTIIQVSALAPEIAGEIRSCAEARFKDRIETTCVSSRVVAGG